MALPAPIKFMSVADLTTRTRRLILSASLSAPATKLYFKISVFPASAVVTCRPVFRLPSRVVRSTRRLIRAATSGELLSRIRSNRPSPIKTGLLSFGSAVIVRAGCSAHTRFWHKTRSGHFPHAKSNTGIPSILFKPVSKSKTDRHTVTMSNKSRSNAQCNAVLYILSWTLILPSGNSVNISGYQTFPHSTPRMTALMGSVFPFRSCAILLTVGMIQSVLHIGFFGKPL